MKNNVKFVRMKKGVTQEQLAKKVGVTRQTIGLIEKGDYNPTLSLCIAIAKELGQTLDGLFWEVE
ncbi:helix-turn-helix transcriptional regulator [Lysinibacillus sp. NPDC096418]|uniref:helix-turn-helix transcriptional regulator n=1 Tax=Lysinibacillus sp. NPDC096418 TaxID=3364138 RepID=UPI00381258EA